MTWFEWAKEHVAKWKTRELKWDAQESVFTPRACQAMALARKEADKLNHNYLCTEHLLLGIIKLNQGVGINVLRKMGINVEDLRSEVEKHISAGPPHSMLSGVPYVPYTPRLKRVIALSREQAKSLYHTYVGTEHFLLGLLVDGGGVAANALTYFKVDLERTRKEILTELDPNFPPPGDAQRENG